MKYIFLISITLLLLLRCNPRVELTYNHSWDNVKSIETSFISHQADTKEKDNKRVAVVNFNPDGSFGSAVQYMTYPYTYMEETEIPFWTAPNHEMLLHIIDGLTLGFAENNFLYGNDWPKSYAEMIVREGHPKFPKRREPYPEYSSSIDFAQSLPITINTNPGFEANEKWYLSGYDEKFEYDQEKVVLYASKFIINKKMMEEMLEMQKVKLKELTEDKQKSMRKAMTPENSFAYIYFEYDGNNLVGVREKKNEYKFVYQEGVLEKSEFYINNKLMNHRLYYYSANGLKEKTVIYNSHNELEYTIVYTYEFYKPI